MENLLVCFNNLVVLLIIRAASCQLNYGLCKSCRKPLIRRFFQNKVKFLLRIILIHEESLFSSLRSRLHFSGQPPLGVHLLLPQGWPLKAGSTVFYWQESWQHRHVFVEIKCWNLLSSLSWQNMRGLIFLQGMWHASAHVWRFDFWSGEPFSKLVFGKEILFHRPWEAWESYYIITEELSCLFWKFLTPYFVFSCKHYQT